MCFCRKYKFVEDVQRASFNLADILLVTDADQAMVQIQASLASAVQLKDKDLQKDCILLKTKVLANIVQNNFIFV